MGFNLLKPPLKVHEKSREICILPIPPIEVLPPVDLHFGILVSDWLAFEIEVPFKQKTLKSLQMENYYL